MATKKAWYMSSQDPMALSLTIRGMLIGFIPLMLELGQQFNMPLTNSGMVEIIESVSLILSLAIVLYGSARRMANWFKRNLR